MTRNLTLILAFCLAIWTTTSAQNVTPVMTTPIVAFTEFAGAPARSIDLTTAFSDPDASTAVSMAVLLPSSTGFFNIALDGQHKPITVANFLNYVNSGRYFMTDPVTHTLASSFIHRSVSNFVVQGGGFIGINSAQPPYAQPTPVPTFPPIHNEPGISALPDPALELRNAQGALVDSNDNWQTSPQKTQIQATGFAPPNAAEPALYVSLPTGNYTAIVRGVGPAPTGTALVEVYPQ
jgi:cyclophilin family peptidyl-prolyl cis-trans isomerase